MSTNSMNMGDRPSRRGRSAASDPVHRCRPERRPMESLHIRVPAELRKHPEDVCRPGRRVHSGVGNPGDSRQTVRLVGWQWGMRYGQSIRMIPLTKRGTTALCSAREDGYKVKEMRHWQLKLNTHPGGAAGGCLSSGSCWPSLSSLESAARSAARRPHWRRRSSPRSKRMNMRKGFHPPTKSTMETSQPRRNLERLVRDRLNDPDSMETDTTRMRTVRFPGGMMTTQVSDGLPRAQCVWGHDPQYRVGLG